MTIVRKIIFETPKMGRMISKEAKEVGTAISKNLPKPKLTRKPTVAQTTFEEGTGANILAEQNRAQIVIRPKQQVSTATGANAVSTTSVGNRPIIQREYHYFNICNKTPQELKQECDMFKALTGAELHVPSVNACDIKFEQAITILGRCAKDGNFPKDIKHVIIGHGTGTATKGDWSIINGGGNILNYIGNNSSIKQGEKVLVLCCEEGGAKIANKNAIGGRVELSLCNYLQPAKIVVKGNNGIAGELYIPSSRLLNDDTRPIVQMYTDKPAFTIKNK